MEGRMAVNHIIGVRLTGPEPVCSREVAQLLERRFLTPEVEG